MKVLSKIIVCAFSEAVFGELLASIQKALGYMLVFVRWL